MQEWKNFIIRLDAEGNFFVALRDGAVCGSEYPSCAEHFEYDLADEICRRIRDRGYVYAVVCDTRGEPVSAASLKVAQPVSESKVREHWDDKLTEMDWEITRALTSGEDPKEFATRLGITVTELLSRMEDAIRRYGLTIDELSRSTKNKNNLTEITKTESERSKSNRL